MNKSGETQRARASASVSPARPARLAELCAIDPARVTIIEAAADCFMEAGFNATSIDDVAGRLDATKGRIYHYYRSKTDLFFDVHRAGMKINLGAIAPIARSNAPAGERLEAMCRTHLSNMLQWINYQRVVMQGVEMHLAGSTTPAQRRELALLMQERETYETLFRGVLVEAREAGNASFGNPSLASKAVLAVLNNPVLWYRRREGESEAERAAIVDEFTRFALNAVGAAVSQPRSDRSSGETHV